MDGFLLVNKPVGPSSAAITNRLKWLFKQNGYLPQGTKNIKIGHGGTLDPLADGLLPVGVGKATKQLQMLLDGPKTYQFTVQFGAQTATDDAEGELIATSESRPTAPQIQAILPQFTGPITQIPPVFSALKVGGQRAYALARAGQSPQLEPRQITIHKLTLNPLPVTPNPLTSATFVAEVSKGTYIRSLGRDLAMALGTVGHITKLCRTQHGPFTLEMAQTPETLDKAIQTGQIGTYLLPLLAVPPAE